MSRRSTRRKAAQQRPDRSSHPRFSTGRQLPRKLRLEPLEARHLLAITVTTLADTVDFNDGLTSLREAIFAANTVPGADTIDFAPALTAAGPATILLTMGELKITDSLTINGPGAGSLTIDAQQQSRIFNIDDGNYASFDATTDVAISGLTLTGGRSSDTGGAIRSLEKLTLSNAVISGNVAYNNFSGAGGGVYIRGAQLDVINCTFSQNYSAIGGGIYSAEGTVTLASANMQNNSANAAGGAAYCSSASLLISDSKVIGNRVGNSGGGIWVVNGLLEISRSRIDDNSSTYGNGGGIYFKGSQFKIQESEISGNTSGRQAGGAYLVSIGGQIASSLIRDNSTRDLGGGIFFAPYAQQAYLKPFEITGCVISSNESKAGGGVFAASVKMRIAESAVSGNSTQFGGGLYCIDCELAIANCTISDNSAVGSGGAVSTVASDATIENTLIQGNSAGISGGALNVSGNTYISNSTITKNSAELRLTWGMTGGGGIATVGNLLVRHSTITENLGGGIVGQGTTVDHTIVASNTSQGFYSPFDVAGDVVLRNSLLSNNAYATIVDLGGNLIGTVEAPIDPLLGPLTDNGGFELPDGSRILTHALLPGSPAINAGDLNAAAGENGVPEFDQRGEPFGRIVGGRIDIGAFEYQTPTDLNLLVDTLADESDGDYSLGDLSLREAIELANQNRFTGVIDTIHFDPALTAPGPATILLTKGELKITDSLTINGPGADLLTIDASGNDPTPEVNDRKGSRVFLVDDGIAASLTTNTISGLRLTGGDIYGSGGAIFSTENLTIAKSIVTNNAIIGDRQGYGGGIFAWRRQGSVAPRLVLQESVISGNATNRNGGGVAVDGGDLEMTSSTIEGNTAGGQGGGVWATGGSVVLNDANLYSNLASWGAGIYRRGGPTSITSSVIEGNQGQWTGAIDNESGKLAIWDSSISYNLAGIGSGGAIYSRFDAIQINESLLRGNIALRDGGGIYGSAVIADSEISGNDAGGGGGGIFTDSLRISGSLIHENSAGAGGGIYSYSGKLSVLNCTISNNTGGTGGGVYRISTDTDTTIRSSTIYDNRAQTGAGIFVATRHDTVMDVEYSSVLGNLAWDMGGGILVLGNGLRINHTSLVGNFALFGYDVTGLLGTTIDATYCVIGDNSQSGFDETPPGESDERGNIVWGPVHGSMPFYFTEVKIVGPPRWKNPLTVLVATPENPGINAGSPAAVAGQGGVTTHDQRGAPFTRVYGGRIDIGAVESIPDGFLPGDYIVDGVVDARDYTAWRDSVSAIVSPGSGADGNGDGAVDERDYAVWKSNFGATVGQLGAGSVVQGVKAIAIAADEWSLANPEPLAQSRTLAPALIHAPQPPALPGVLGGNERTWSQRFVPRDHAVAAWFASRRPATLHDAESEIENRLRDNHQDVANSFDAALATLEDDRGSARRRALHVLH